MVRFPTTKQFTRLAQRLTDPLALILSVLLPVLIRPLARLRTPVTVTVWARLNPLLLFKVTLLKVVADVPVMLCAAAPLKLTSIKLLASGAMLKTLLLMRLPPIFRTCVVLDWVRAMSVPLLVILPATVNVREVLLLPKSSMPPAFTVRNVSPTPAMETSTVTVLPLQMVAESPGPGSALPAEAPPQPAVDQRLLPDQVPLLLLK